MTAKELAIHYAWQFIGVPYEWGGDNAQGLDCSGFVGVILRAVGLIGNREDLTASGIYTRFSYAMTEKPKAGNLVLYGSSFKDITHIGFMVSDLHILEAGGGGSKTTDIQKADDHNAFVRARPYDYRKIVAMVHPFAQDGSVKA